VLVEVECFSDLMELRSKVRVGGRNASSHRDCVDAKRRLVLHHKGEFIHKDYLY
jgi:hypothetical protein